MYVGACVCVCVCVYIYKSRIEASSCIHQVVVYVLRLAYEFHLCALSFSVCLLPPRFSLLALLFSLSFSLSLSHFLVLFFVYSLYPAVSVGPSFIVCALSFSSSGQN